MRKFESLKNNIKGTWNTINYILKPNCNKSNNDVTSIISNDTTLFDKFDISAAFNNYFSTVGSNISDSIPNVSRKGFLDFMNSISIVNSFLIRPVTISDVKQTILSLKNSSSPLNTYPSIVLKILEPLISPILVKLINDSFTCSYCPEFLKIARVIPILKIREKN